jgi:hypothetical protein
MLGDCALSTPTIASSTGQDFTHFSTITIQVGIALHIHFPFCSTAPVPPATIHSHTNERPVACSNGGGPENCQSNILSLEGGLSNINLYCLSTVGSTNMITENGKTLASYSDNVNVFPDTIALFQTGVVTPPSGGSSLIGWNFRGCYTDKVSARTLGNTMSVPGGPSAMSVEACLAVCQAAGYSLAGVEYSAECCKFTAPLECFKKEISDI